MAKSSILSALIAGDNELPYFVSESSNTFLHYFNIKMHAYVRSLRGISENALEGMQKDFFIDRINEVIERLKETLRVYLEGYPAAAYVVFNAMIENTELASELIELRTVVLPRNHSLFRIRKEYDLIPLKRRYNGFQRNFSGLDLFHVPFEKRRGIGTNRFSISGFPCVYASDSLMTSWAECMLQPDDPFHAVCFRNHRPLYVIDMVPLPLSAIKREADKHSDKPLVISNLNHSLLSYAILYPLILACHSKVRFVPAYTGEVQFKSEYIVPQLLLEWYRTHKVMVDGVRYLSCSVQEKFSEGAFSKYNYVIPVIETKERGYCDHLVHNFSSSPVYTHVIRRHVMLDTLVHIEKQILRKAFVPVGESIQPNIP